MSPAAEPDVLIVGGSLVGLSTALWLRIHGVSCLAVERHSSTAIHPRAGHFQLRTVEILQGAGLEDVVRRKGEEQYHPNGGINNVESHLAGAVSCPPRRSGGLALGRRRRRLSGGPARSTRAVAVPRP